MHSSAPKTRRCYSIMCMHRSPTVCYCTVTYPTLPISAFHIIWFYIYGVFPSVVQNLLRDTGRKTTDNNLSEATYRILCKERSLTEVAREISPTNPKGPVLYCSDSGKASPVPDHSTVLPDYSSSFFRFTGLSITYFIPSFFFFFNCTNNCAVMCYTHCASSLAHGRH